MRTTTPGTLGETGSKAEIVPTEAGYIFTLDGGKGKDFPPRKENPRRQPMRETPHWRSNLPPNV